MRKRNNKGFTLVELLVTISILGIVSVMAMPIVRNIVEANNMKKFITYKDSVESSAKLYVDSYADDLFGKRKSGCTYVTYDQMQEKSLIKDILQDSVSCDSSKTFVKVVKLNGKYSYSSQIGCGSSNEKNKNIKDSEIKILYPKDEISKTETCNFDSNLRFKYLVVPENYTGTSKKRLEVKIRLTSATGILHNGEEIYYTWRESRDDASKDTWTKASFKGVSNSKQEKEILGGNDITIDSRSIVSPDKKTGNYYLAVKFVKVFDITGTSLTDEEKTVTFGPFNIDNDPPVINSLNIVSSDSSFNSTAVKVNIQATDNNKLSSIKELSVCVKTDNSECEDDDFEDYKGSYPLRLTGKYDGSTKKVYAWVKDNAGNISEKKEATYQVYKECSTVKIDKSNLISKGSCSKKCGSGSRLDKYGLVDKHTEKKCSGEKVVTEKCNTMDCCSEVKYSDSESCSKKCGGGTYGQSAYSKYDSSIRCPSRDKKTGGSKCNTQSCCDDVTYKDGDKCSKTCGGGTHNKLAYSKTDGSRCPSKDTSSGGSSCNTQSCCEKFTYGSWKDWSSWGTCSAACGTGKQTRTRARPKFSTYDKSSCGNDVETQSRDCTIKPTCCNGATVSYSSWSDCSTSCGTGVQTRKKTTIPCEGSPSVVTEERSCTVITPDQYVSSTAWSCNVSCGTGINERYNTYKKCDGSTYRVKETGSACDTGKSCCTGDKLIKTGNWSCTGVCGTGTQQRTNTYQKCDGSTYTKTEKGSSCSLEPCKPNKPTITNPTNGNWTNKDFSLTVKTTTTSNLGYWYYSYDKKNWVIYNNENYNSYGKNVYKTSPFTAERNQAVYIRVCNKKATRPTDSTNCSDYASTNIKIDKTPPTLTRTSNFNNCKKPQHPVNKKTYGQTVGHFEWYDNSNGSGMAAVEMDYSFTHKKKYCSHFRTAVSGKSSNNGIWIKYGGAARWRIIVYDVAGNSTKLTGKGNCSKDVLYTVDDGASYINNDHCNF